MVTARPPGQPYDLHMYFEGFPVKATLHFLPSLRAWSSVAVFGRLSGFLLASRQTTRQ